MRAAGNAWISVVVLVAGIALLPGLLYLLGLALVDGRPKPADRAPVVWLRAAVNHGQDTSR
jgi:hypothetical protein